MSNEIMGSIRLRVSNIKFILLYAGHIGYEVYEKFRGHHYAAISCKLLFKFAKMHNLKEIWITVSPDNKPSYRTCELAGGTLVEIIDIPK